MRRRAFIYTALLVCALTFFLVYKGIFRPLPYNQKEVQKSLFEQLADKGLILGSPIFIRIFKESAVLEVWIQNENQAFTHFKTYPICAYSGTLGPKLKEGDMQSPEGFYHVTRSHMNPNSSYHLSFNLGFPNA